MLNESNQTNCPRCNLRNCSDGYIHSYALQEDDRLPTQLGTLGYCEGCKRAYYLENREQVFKAYQDYLDSFPTPAYIYGLIDPRYRLIYYIGRTYHLERRIREHRQDDNYHDPRVVYTRELHWQGLTFEWCKLATVVPGCYVYEMEARWICHGIQQGWPLTNAEAQPDYSHAMSASKEAIRDYFTCSFFALPCSDRKTIRRVGIYARWLESKPAELPDQYAHMRERWEVWRQEGYGRHRHQAV